MTAVTLALDAAMAPLLIAAAAIGLLFVGITAATNIVNADTEKEIRQNADAIKVLSESIENLNNALADSVGSEYIQNIKQQIAATKEMIRIQQEQIKNQEELSTPKHQNGGGQVVLAHI